MRGWPLLVPLALAISTPAMAEDEDIWDDDPYAAQDNAVLAIDGIIGALLDMPIGRLASVVPDVEIEGDIRHGDTLRDMMVRNNPDAEEELRGKARMATAVIGTMLNEFEALLPELERWGERFSESLPD